MPEFIALAAWLHPPLLQLDALPEPELPPAEAAPEPAAVDEDAIAEVLSRVRRFRAMLADALDRSLADLLRDICTEVVGRELYCAPADLQRIVQRALERAAPGEPLAVHVHPSQLELVQIDLPVVGDDRLRTDDVRIELRSGTIDASLGVRIEQMLASYGA